MTNERLIFALALSFLSGGSMAAESVPTQISQGYEVTGVYQMGNYKVELRLDPPKPTVRQALAAHFTVWDLSQDPPAPVRGAKLSCVVRMPGMPGHDHKGRVHEQPHRQNWAGSYAMHPISLTMVGHWELALKVQTPDGQKLSAAFPFDVEDLPWPDNPNADNIGPRTNAPTGTFPKSH